MYWNNEFVDAGSLMSYGTNYADPRRALLWTSVALKDAKPAELPVEQSMSRTRLDWFLGHYY